jgi:hypothetical protein
MLEITEKPNTNRVTFRIFATVFILIALHASPNGPQNERYVNSVRSLVEFGTFALQKGYSSHVDTVNIGGTLYSVIPPGIPIILSPLYFIYHAISLHLGIIPSENYWQIFSILTTVLVMAPILGLAAILMFKVLGKFTEDLSKKLWLVFIFIFGSPVFFYSTYGIWSHAYTMTFLLMAFYLTISKRSNFCIGLCLGLAQFVDYAAMVPISILGGFWLYTKIKNTSRNLLKEIILLSFGYLLILSFLLYYNYTVTGSIFKTPASIFLKDIKMFSLPSPESLWGLTFSPYRGIFLYFPMTFLFITSLIKKVYLTNKIALFSFLYVGFVFVFNSTYYAWSGDVCFGPRHLLVTIPFIVIPIVYCQIKYIRWLGILSIFINLAGVSTIPSDNLFINLAIFLCRGPFLQWQDYLYKVILPQYFKIHLSLMTPFFIYVATAFVIYKVWNSFQKEKKEGIQTGLL